jgi:hypothetical protein
MDTEARTKGRIVDLLRYREARRQQRLDFTEGPAARPALAVVTPFRPLCARQVAHRERMLEFLHRQRRVKN